MLVDVLVLNVDGSLWYSCNCALTTHPLRFPDNTNVYKILISRHLTKPEGIAVDPDKRWVNIKIILFPNALIGLCIFIETICPVYIPSIPIHSNLTGRIWHTGMDFAKFSARMIQVQVKTQCSNRVMIVLFNATLCKLYLCSLFC
jgi:hypothetical protein